MVKNLEQWFTEITTPRTELGGKPICPFAKIAITNRQYIIEQVSLETVQGKIQQADIETYKVCIYYLLEYQEYGVEYLESKTRELNSIFIEKNKVVLDNDPRNPFIVNSIRTNFPDCYIWVVQDLADLTSKSTSLQLTDYYSYWSKQQLDEVVTWRNLTKI